MLFTHVGSELGVSWGEGGGTGMVSVEYMFHGVSSHAAAAPWLGKSALDAVELMDIAWNFKREHLRTQQRSHYVITSGGDQPNVVPPYASVWYYFRETDYAHIKELWDLGDTMAKAAAMMTGTTFESRVLGSAWPQHGNRPIAEVMFDNIKAVGMPDWSDADQQFAHAFQRARGAPERGLSTSVAASLRGRESIPEEEQTGGASDDIGDVMWSAPTVTLRFPSNIPGAIGHHWTSAVAMATPVAHKGATQGAKVMAMTVLDLLMRPDVTKAARDYFENIQQAPAKYKPLLRPEDQAGRLVEQGHDGQVQAGASEVLLRPHEVQVVSGAARHRVPSADASGTGTVTVSRESQGTVDSNVRGRPFRASPDRQSARSRRNAFAMTITDAPVSARIAIQSVATPATAATTKATFITSEIARLALMFLSVVRLNRSA